MKSFISSKTNLVAIVTVIIGALSATQGLNLSPEVMGYIMTVIGVLNFILRTFLTNSAVSIGRGTGDR